MCDANPKPKEIYQIVEKRLSQKEMKIRELK